MHGGRLRKGELRVLMVIETWLTAEHRFRPNNPLHGIRLVACCLACDAPLEVDAAGDRARALPSGELIVTCTTCPMGNVVESIGGDPAATRLWEAPRAAAARLSRGAGILPAGHEAPPEHAPSRTSDTGPTA